MCKTNYYEPTKGEAIISLEDGGGRHSLRFESSVTALRKDRRDGRMKGTAGERAMSKSLSLRRATAGNVTGLNECKMQWIHFL